MEEIVEVYKVGDKEFSSYTEAENYVTSLKLKKEENNIFCYDENFEPVTNWQENFSWVSFISVHSEDAKKLLTDYCSEEGYYSTNLFEMKAPFYACYIDGDDEEDWVEIDTLIKEISDQLEAIKNAKDFLQEDALKKREK